MLYLLWSRILECVTGKQQHVTSVAIQTLLLSRPGLLHACNLGPLHFTLLRSGLQNPARGPRSAVGATAVSGPEFSLGSVRLWLLGPALAD